jgi:transcriptional regulator NrdR family protein
MDRYVIKANGNKELFNKEKIQSSLIKAGSSQLLANSMFSKFEL